MIEQLKDIFKYIGMAVYMAMMGIGIPVMITSSGEMLVGIGAFNMIFSLFVFDYFFPSEEKKECIDFKYIKSRFKDMTNYRRKLKMKTTREELVKLGTADIKKLARKELVSRFSDFTVDLILLKIPVEYKEIIIKILGKYNFSKRIKEHIENGVELNFFDENKDSIPKVIHNESIYVFECIKNIGIHFENNDLVSLFEFVEKITNENIQLHIGDSEKFKKMFYDTFDLELEKAWEIIRPEFALNDEHKKEFAKIAAMMISMIEIEASIKVIETLNKI